MKPIFFFKEGCVKGLTALERLCDGSVCSRFVAGL